MPADDSSNGFDNIADVLGVSPALLERYVSAAAKISRLAVGDPETAPLDITYTLKGDLSQTGTLEGQPLGTRGGTVVRHNFPLDGEYLIKLSLTKLSFGQVFGEGAENEELEVTLNGQRVKLYKLDEVPMFFMRETPGSHPAKEPPTDPLEERVKMTPDIRLEFRVTVKAGPQNIGVAFLQKSRAAIEDLVHRPLASMRDVNTGMQYGYTSVPHLARVDITGPYNATGPGDTPSRRRIFVCRPSAPAERDSVRPPDLHEPRRPCVPPPRGGRRSAVPDALLSGGAEQYGTLRRRNRDGPAPHPRRSGIRLPIRAAAGRGPARRRVSNHRPAARLAPVLLPLVQRSRR